MRVQSDWCRLSACDAMGCVHVRYVWSAVSVCKSIANHDRWGCMQAKLVVMGGALVQP